MDKSVTRPGWQHNHQDHIRQNEKLQSRGTRSPVVILQIGRVAKFIHLKGIENECPQLSEPQSLPLRQSCWSFLHRIYSCLCIIMCKVLKTL